jgi:hypothetical protein
MEAKEDIVENRYQKQAHEGIVDWEDLESAVVNC